MTIEKELIKNKIADIDAIEFGDTAQDITSSLLIVMTMFEVDDDPDVIRACKCKLYDGIAKLKKIGADGEAEKIEKKIN